MPTTRRFRPRFEALEDRRLMAADCGCDQWLDGSADPAVEVAAAEGACAVPQAAEDEEAAAWGLNLVDASGAPVALEFNANTLVLAVATWCPHCLQLEAELALPEYREALAGLRLVFVFGDEGGAGPGGVRDAAVLDALPGDVAFLGPGSARPPHFPSVYDPATGQFAGDPREAIAQWYADQPAPDQPANQPAGASPRFEPSLDATPTNDAPQFLPPIEIDPVGDANRGLAPAGSIGGANRGLAPNGTYFVSGGRRAVCFAMNLVDLGRRGWVFRG